MDAEEPTTGWSEPPEEPYELLELLESIIQDFIDHFKRRFQDSFQDRSDLQLTRMRLPMQLAELHLFLSEYIKQGSPVSKEVGGTAHQIAETLKSTLHGGRIRDVLRTERLETRIATAEVRVDSYQTGKSREARKQLAND